MLKLPNRGMMLVMKKGSKMSEESRQKISLSRKRFVGENHPRFGKKHSEETKTKISLARTGYIAPDSFRLKMSSVAKKGEFHWNWQGGIAKENAIIRTSVHYKIWRKAVFERDNYTCVWCGAHNGNGKKVILNADHIKRFADYPELRFEIGNGRTLCRPCHVTTFKKC